MGGQGRMPEPKELDDARALVGMRHVILDEKEFSVRFDRAGVILDLGAIGKGHAIDCAARLLRECGVTSALLHGGTSTTCALGAPPDAEAWRVAVAAAPDVPGQTTPVQTVLRLRDEALSVSAVWGRSFEAGGRTYGHVLDPRTGEPVSRAVLAAVVLPSATETDALSTALLVEGLAGAETIKRLRPGMRVLVSGGTGQILRFAGRDGALRRPDAAARRPYL